mgnify:CR=1 FL=1
MAVNASTIIHHLRNIAAAAGYELSNDSLAELRDAFDNIDEFVALLRHAGVEEKAKEKTE